MENVLMKNGDAVNGKKRDVSLDVLKFIATIMITNSHMGVMYGKYSVLATGGSIGDALFFFCSGYGLFLKPLGGGLLELVQKEN